MLTIHEAATATGWSSRMLRYVETLGLVEPVRSSAGYRLYGPVQVDRLRSLRRMVDEHGVELGDVGFALRLRREPDLARTLSEWFDDAPTPVQQSAPSPGSDWLAYEKTKHQQLLPLTHQGDLAPTTEGQTA